MPLRGSVVHQTAGISSNPPDEYFFAEGCYITEWWNSPGDSQASIARARLEPGMTTRWHRLRGVTERYAILSGRGRVEVGELAAQDVTVGCIVLIPPGVAQRIRCIGEEDLVFLAVCTPRFEPDCYEDLQRETTSPTSS